MLFLELSKAAGETSERLLSYYRSGKVYFSEVLVCGCAKYCSLGGGLGRGLRCFSPRDSYRKPLCSFAISVN